MSGSPPSRSFGVLLAFLLPPGVGHAYVGQTRRGAVWLVGCLLVSVAATLGALKLGGRGALVLLVAGAALRWLGPAVDVLALPRARVRATDLTALVLFLVVGIVLAAVNAFGGRVFFLESFRLPSAGMVPTLLVGDHVLVDKLAYRTREPRRGEVMVFAFPERRDQDFIKRVIAFPGDRFEVKNGHPWLDGWEVPHCKLGPYSYLEEESSVRHTGELDVEFLGDQSYLTFYDAAVGSLFEQQGPFYPKSGEYWVMGDNRNNSHDSRMWFAGAGGGVPRDLLRGHVLLVWLSTGPGGVDKSRTGQDVEGPTLPKGSESLQPVLDACLRARPAQTTPPRAP